jgi:hypothetical protein
MPKDTLPPDARQSILALQAENQMLRQALHQRGEPLAMAVLDCFDSWVNMAEAKNHPANAAARQLIQRWIGLQEKMRPIAHGIVIAAQVDD